MSKTIFNPEGKDILTIGEANGPAMEITSADDAAQYKRAYIEYIQRHRDAEQPNDGLTAEQVVNSNLGYYAGYYDTATRERVERLFNCAHPVFGAIKDGGGNPSPEAAFALGKTLANS